MCKNMQVPVGDAIYSDDVEWDCQARERIYKVGKAKQNHIYTLMR